MMKFFAALLCVFSGLAHAQPALLTDLALPYLASSPAAAKDAPLVIFLHGYGSDERDLFGIKGDLSPDYTYLSVRAPLDVDGGGHKWFSQDTDVADYVKSQPGAEEFLDAYVPVLTGVAEGYLREGKRFMRVALGCTGGKHRSVAMSEEIGRRLAEHGLEVRVTHRDLGRE